MPPTRLGSVTQLQALKLHCCWLLPSNSDEDAYWDETQALVGVLPALSRLQDLTLVFRSSMEFPHPSHRFDVLTASSRLTRLVVGSSFGSNPLPRGAVEQMFPVHQQQPQLQCLAISLHGTMNATTLVLGALTALVSPASAAAVLGCVN